MAVNPFAYAADLLDPPADPHLQDPAGWITDRLGEHLWSMQRRIVDAVRDHPKVAVHSAHDTGKSYTAGRIAAWWLDVHPVGEAFVVSTAPTYKQVHAVLWEEIRSAHRRAGLPGRVTQSDEWKIGDQLVGYGRKPADHDEHGFQGIHRRYVLAILDEACGIPPALWVGVDAITTNDEARILAIGNPDNNAVEFAQVCKPDSGWHVIRIDGLQTPNIDRPTLARALGDVGFGATEHERAQRDALLAECPDTREDVPDELRRLLLAPGWVADKAKRWGVDSPLFTAKVRGEFPDTSESSVIPLAWVRAAQQRWAENVRQGSLTQAGVDVAREGSDRTTVAFRYGWRVDSIEVVPPGDTMHTTGHVNRLVGDHVAVVDVIGIGSGVVDRRRELGKPTVAFNAGAGCPDLTDQSGEFGFTNRRAAAWWGLREMLDPANGMDLELPDDEELAAELTAPQWTATSGGRVKVESKDDIRKRLGRSTDLADAVIQAFWINLGGAEPVDDEPDFELI